MYNNTVLPSSTSTLLKIGILFSGLFILYGFVPLLMYILANISLLVMSISSMILNVILYIIAVNIMKTKVDFDSTELFNTTILLSSISILAGFYAVSAMNVSSLSVIFLLLFFFLLFVLNIFLILLGNRLLKREKSIPYIKLFSLGLFSNVIFGIIMYVFAFTSNYHLMIAFTLIKHIVEGGFYFSFFYFNLQRINSITKSNAIC